MVKIIRHITYLLIVLICSSYSDVSSPDKDTVEELRKKADKHFENGEYQDALIPYQKLLSLEQSNYEFRFKYGACLLFATGDKQKALEFLEEAQGRNGVPTDIYYYLGKAYHLNYRFTPAIEAYRKYEQFASGSDKEKFAIKRQIEMARNGEKLLKNVTDVAVVTKKNANQTKYYDLYSLNNIGGTIINAKSVDALRSKIDKKKGQDIIIHLPDQRVTDIVYYASYGENGNNGKDIYQIQRLASGEWGEPKFVSGGVNTKYDEDFPYMHPDGKHLYFCSKGHNSMGGYDVFRSTKNPDGTFSDPENMDFAINTPDDDLLYIVDSLNQTAYFASNRENASDKFHVYNVKVARYPVMMAIIKGEFKNQIDPTRHKLTIVIKDELTGETSNEKHVTNAKGEYLITLPRSGKYTYIISSDQSSQIHKKTITVPYQKKIKVYPQEIRLFEHNGEQVEIIDKFSETHPDNDAILAELFNKKSKLDPNLDDLKDATPLGTSDQTVDLGEITDQDIIDMAQKDASDIREKLNNTSKKKDAAYAVAGDYFKKAIDADKKASDAAVLAKKATNPEEKSQYESMAKDLINQSKEYAKNATAAKEIAEKLEKEEKDLTQDYDVANQFTKGIKEAIDGNNRTVTEQKLKEQQAFIMDVIKREESNNDQEKINALEAEYRDAQDASAKVERTVKLLNDEQTNIRGDILNLENELADARKKDKPEIEKKITSKKEALSTIEKDIEEAKDRLAERKSEESAAQKELDLALGNFETTHIAALTEQEKASIIEKLNNNYLENVIETREKDLAEISETAVASSSNVDVENDPKYISLKNQSEQAADISDPKNKLEKQIEVDKQWVDFLNNDISLLQDQMNNESDPLKKSQLQDQINKLDDLRDEKQQDLSGNEIQLASLQTASTPKDITLAETSPDYQTDYTAAAAIADPVERATKQNTINQKALSDLTKAENKVKDQQKDGVISQTVAENQLNQIAALRSEIDSKIAANKTLIAQNSSTVINISPDVEYKDLDSDFQTKKAAITASSQTDVQKAEKIIELNKAMINKIDADIAATTQRLNDGRLDEGIAKDRLGDLEEMKDKLEDEINSSTQLIAAVKDLGVGAIGPNVAKTDLVPDFDARKSTIKSKTDISEADQAKEIIKLNDELLEEINNEILRTDRLRADGTISNSIAESRLNGLLDLKSEIQEDNKNQTKIVKGGVPTIALNDVSPDFETEYASINNSEESELNKARSLKSLNSEAITNINKEIQSTELKRKNGEITDEQAKKITDQLVNLRTERTSDLNANETIIANQGANYNKPSVTYSSKEAKKSYESTATSREKSDTYAQQIAALKVDKESASEKQQAKINKKIDKLDDKKAKEDIKTGELLGVSNKAEFEVLDKEMSQLIGQLRANGKADESNPDYRSALKNGTNGDDLFAKAISKRTSASKESELSLKSDLLRQAVENEQLAILQKSEGIKKLKQMNDAVYVAGSLTNPEAGKEEITDVAEDVDKRRSTELYDQAETYESRATEKEITAALKRKEAETAKRKDKEALLTEADALQNEADVLRNNADKLNSKAESIKNEEEKILAKETHGRRTLSQAEEERIRKLSDYVPYYDRMVDMVNARVAYLEKLENKEGLIDRIRSNKDELNSLKLQHIAADVNSKVALEAQINTKQNEISEDESELATLRSEIDNMYGQLNEFRTGIESHLASISDDYSRSFTELTGTDGAYLPEPIVFVAADPLDGTFEVPDQLNGSDIFKKSDEAIYNDDNPIPVDAINPSGLVYKVQVGAFRNPIPQDLFADFAPVSGERLGNGITRYMVGYFGTFGKANNARGEIIGFQGYEGSFVVAYIDGERVTLDQARAYEGDNSIVATTTVENTSSETPAIVTQPTGETITYTEDPNLTRKFEETGNPEEAIQGKGIKGLYFTVQVGAFSRPIQKGELNVAPLVYFEVNGLWKYTTGVFKNVEEATKRKDQVRNNGTVPDAFVTAFLDGRKVTIARANELLAEQGESILTGSVASTNPTTSIPGTNTTPPDPNTNTTTPVRAGSTINVVVDGLEYYVLLGKFNGAASKEFTTVLLRNYERVTSVKNNDGTTEYRSLIADKYTTTLDYLEFFEEEGLINLQIIPVYKGKVITNDQAETLRNGGTIGTVSPRGGPPNESTVIDRSSEPIAVENLEYRVILGTFEGNAPQNFSNIIVRNSDKGILSEQNETFQTVYFIPNFSTFAQAQQMKDYFENEGLEKIAIKAYFESKEISLEDAKLKTNE